MSTHTPHVVFARPWWRDWPWNWTANRRQQQLVQTVADHYWSRNEQAMRDAYAQFVRYGTTYTSEFTYPKGG